jgi:hypothetical protein
MVISFGSLFVCWWAIAIGFNIASTVTVSLLSKQLPPEWSRWTSLAIQYANYTGRVSGAIWGELLIPFCILNLRYSGTDCVDTRLRRWFGRKDWHAKVCGPRNWGAEPRHVVLRRSLEGLEGEEGLMRR